MSTDKYVLVLSNNAYDPAWDTDLDYKWNSRSKTYTVYCKYLESGFFNSKHQAIHKTVLETKDINPKLLNLDLAPQFDDLDFYFTKAEAKELIHLARQNDSHEFTTTLNAPSQRFFEEKASHHSKEVSDDEVQPFIVIPAQYINDISQRALRDIQLDIDSANTTLDAGLSMSILRDSIQDDEDTVKFMEKNPHRIIESYDTLEKPKYSKKKFKLSKDKNFLISRNPIDSQSYMPADEWGPKKTVSQLKKENEQDKKHFKHHQELEAKYHKSMNAFLPKAKKLFINSTIKLRNDLKITTMFLPWTKYHLITNANAWAWGKNNHKPKQWQIITGFSKNKHSLIKENINEPITKNKLNKYPSFTCFQIYKLRKRMYKDKKTDYRHQVFVCVPNLIFNYQDTIKEANLNYILRTENNRVAFDFSQSDEIPVKEWLAYNAKIMTKYQVFRNFIMLNEPLGAKDYLQIPNGEQLGYGYDNA